MPETRLKCPSCEAVLNGGRNMSVRTASRLGGVILLAVAALVGCTGKTDRSEKAGGEGKNGNGKRKVSLDKNVEVILPRASFEAACRKLALDDTVKIKGLLAMIPGR